MGIDSTNNVPKDTVYVVKPGDTMSELAIRYNTTLESILKANGMNRASVHSIEIGQKLKITMNDASSEVMSKRQHDEKIADYHSRLNDERRELRNLGYLGVDGKINDSEAVKQYYVNKDLKDGRLEFVPEKTSLLIFKTPAYYKYTSSDEGIETYGDLKRRYNIPDGVIRKYNPWIDNISYQGNDLDGSVIEHSVKIPLECCCQK